VLAAVLAVAYCDHHTCDSLAREKVKHQWQVAYHHNRGQFGLAVWRALFAQDEDAKDLFHRVGVDDMHSADFQAHSGRVFGGLDTVISCLDDEATLVAELAHLKGQHDERNIPDAYYRHFYQALEKVMNAMLGPCFNYEAWDACGDIVFHGITGH